jgi:hypothetical protein
VADYGRRVDRRAERRRSFAARRERDASNVGRTHGASARRT